MEQVVFRAMGCELTVLLDAPPASATAGLAAVQQWFATWEQQLSRFRDDSELSVLNRSQGQWLPVGAVLWDVLDAAIHAAAQTNGLVTPTVLDALHHAGYDRSWPLIGQQQHGCTATTAAPAPPPVANWRAIERDAEARAVRLPPGVRLDLGGIAKGWAAQRAADLLKPIGPALVDAGGDIAVNGPWAAGAPWTVGVADPHVPERDLQCIALWQGGVATSGRDYRRWQQHGVWQHHLIDPRTGQPARGDVLSATVIAPSAYRAEVAAKVVVLRGSVDGLRWLDTEPTLAGLVVLENGVVHQSERFAHYHATSV